jgi:uncharacterized heparinase superfamily protein
MIISSRGKAISKFFRRHTRSLRFLGHLIRLKWRLALAPVWPLDIPTYSQYLQDPWQGEASRGLSLLNGTFCDEHGGKAYEKLWECGRELPYDIQLKMHEFGWLRDLAQCTPKAEAAEKARRLIDEWWEVRYQHIDSAMRMTTRAERLSNCLLHHEFLLKGASQVWLRRQNRYYQNEIISLADMLRRREHVAGFTAMKALLFASMVFPSMKFLLAPVNRYLIAAIKSRLCGDGGHRTRSAEFLHWDMTMLLGIRAALKGRKLPIAPVFDEVVQNGLDALATLTHGDGKTACFHSSIERPVQELNNLWMSWRKSKPLPQKILPKSGYAHLYKKDAHLIMDVGYQPALGIYHYAGPLAFEFSREGARFIVNCGAYRGSHLAWQEVSYHTAAHSSFSVNGVDAWEGLEDEADAKMGHCSVEEDEKGIEIRADHCGYTHSLGLLHERQIHLNEQGDLLKGQDRILRVSSASEKYAKRTKACLRFHLHPSVSVAKVTPKFLMLRLKNDEFWEFSIEDAEESVPLVEESVYLGEKGIPQKSVQLVIPLPSLSDQKESVVKWRLALSKTVQGAPLSGAAE